MQRLSRGLCVLLRNVFDELKSEHAHVEMKISQCREEDEVIAFELFTCSSFVLDHKKIQFTQA